MASPVVPMVHWRRSQNIQCSDSPSFGRRSSAGAGSAKVRSTVESTNEFRRSADAVQKASGPTSVQSTLGNAAPGRAKGGEHQAELDGLSDVVFYRHDLLALNIIRSKDGIAFTAAVMWREKVPLACVALYFQVSHFVTAILSNAGQACLTADGYDNNVRSPRLHFHG
jgi:hypothetical protein